MNLKKEIKHVLREGKEIRGGMTVQELLERLEDAVADGYGDAICLIAMQPNYPLQSHIRGIAISGEVNLHDRDDFDDEPGPRVDEEGQKIVWIVESHQVREMPYAPRDVFDAAN